MRNGFHGPLAIGLVVAAALAAVAPAAADGWAALRELRAGLETRPQVADFVHQFLPAGFSTGDSETGRLTLALPGCLRWDYDEPSPESYLLCKETIWTWNPGESSGRTFTVDPEEERGLDLLRLSVERLAERYTAELVDGPEATRAIHFEPKGPAAEIADATLTLTAGGDSVAELSYRDVEGNTTRFAFSGHRPLATETGNLRPPDDLTWIED